MLLGKRVLVHGDGRLPTHVICDAVLTLASLLPGLPGVSLDADSFGKLVEAGGPLHLLWDSMNPLVSLQQIDSLMGSAPLLAGCTNQLLVLHPSFSDLTVSVGSSATVLFKRPEIKTLLDLSTPDLRFCDAIYQVVSPPELAPRSPPENSWLC